MNLRNFAAAMAALGSDEKRGQRVIGGRESTNGRYSYAVSLADNLGSFCGGSLIAPDIILSAAVSCTLMLISDSTLSFQMKR